MKKAIYITLLMLIAFGNLNAQEQQKQEDKIDKRIEVLEEQNLYLQQQIFDLNKNKIESEIVLETSKNIENSVEQARQRESFFLNWATVILTGLTIIISIISVLGFKNFKEYKIELKESFKKQAEIEFAKIKSENLTTIKRMIDNEDWSFKLIDRSNILLLNPVKKGDDKNLIRVLKEFKYQELETKFENESKTSWIDNIGNEIKNKSLNNKLNIVLLENSDGSYKLGNDKTKQNVIDISAKLPVNTFLIYFGPKNAGYFPGDITDYKRYPNSKEIVNKLSFVNAPSKLYSNILDTLKFMDIVQNLK